MARLYSNENFPLDIAKELRKLGHDVLTSYEAKKANQGISDPEVLAFATSQNRAIITLNREDFLKLHRSGISHAGIIICKDDRDYVGQAQIAHAYLLGQDDLRNRLVRVKKQNQPSSSIQIFITQEYKR